MRVVALGLPLLGLAVGSACGTWPEDDVVPTPLRDAETAALAALQVQPVAVRGRVVDPEGLPVAGAAVQLDAVATTTGVDGGWALEELPRRNALLQVSAPGFRTWVSAVQLVLPPSTAELELATVPLDRDEADTVRLLFTGDMALGRRYLDPTDTTPRDELPIETPDALIRRSTAAPDSVAIVESMLPYFEAADFRVVNLETPVTDDPRTPHRDKEYAFFTLPGSLDALRFLGVGMVSLGNNHVYDYLDDGLLATRRNLVAAGLPFAGAGLTPDEAFVPVEQEVRGQPFTFLSATTITGEDRTWPLFIADAQQGGAADLRDSARVDRVLGQATEAGRWPIALMHMGNEYARHPNAYALDRAARVREAGAVLAVAHHPHTIQGFSRVDGMFFAHSMGNFAFDQDRLETLPGYLLTTDVRDGDVVRASLSPQLVDDYRARPACGALADRIARDAGELSDRPSVYVASYAGRGFIAEAPEALVRTTRVVDVPVILDADGAAVLDLRPHRVEGESLARLEAPRRATWSLGLDLLRFGDFEDDDVDADWLENARWYRGASSAPCVTGAFRGAAGMCTWRVATDRDPGVVAFRNRIRVLGDSTNEPLRDLSLVGRSRADNAGYVEVYVRWYASVGEKVFGDEAPVRVDGGTWDWRPFAATLHMPGEQDGARDPWEDNPRALRVFVAQWPPEEGEGLLAVDDLAVVTWHAGPWEGSALDVQTPSGADFVRGVGLQAGDVVRVTLEQAVPTAVAR